MLHSLMIISGRGGIVLFRKVFTKSLQQPRLIAGLVTALCEFSTNSLGQPAAHIELETTTVTIIEQPVDILDSSGETLRAVVFHDTEDPDLYGQVIGTQLLNVFKQEFGERLLSMQLANVQGVEEIFRGFNSRIRTVMAESVEPLMHLLEADAAVRYAFLVRHRMDGVGSNWLERMWYCAEATVGSSIIADLQALLAAGDDVLSSHADEANVITVGENVRIERLELATLMVVSETPKTFSDCLEVIGMCTKVLKQCKFG